MRNSYLPRLASAPPSLSLPHSTHVQRFKDGKGERVRERKLKLLLGAKKGEKPHYEYILYIYLIHFIVVSRPVAFCRTLRIWLSLHYASRFYFIIIYIFLPFFLAIPFYLHPACVWPSLLSEHIPLCVIFPAIRICFLCFHTNFDVIYHNPNGIYLFNLVCRVW